jgi:PhnB protein
MADENQSPVGGVTAHPTIRDGRANEAVSFYQQAFGATEQMRHLAEDGKRLMHSNLSLNGGTLLLNDDFADLHSGEPEPPPAGVRLHLEVPDADAVWDKAVAAGAKIEVPLENQFWGSRYGMLRDPFGFAWSIGGPKKG